MSATIQASPPGYGNGKPSQDKIEYCNRLVKMYGHRSQSLNRTWYGKGVKAPTASKWELRIKDSWFDDDLYVVFEQTTADDFEHSAYCLWSEDAPWFEFRINEHVYGGVLQCYLYADIAEQQCP